VSSTRFAKCLLALTVLLCAGAVPAAVAQEPEGLDDLLLSTVRRGYINLGVLIQGVFEVPAFIRDRGDYAFSIAEARGLLYGRVEGGLSYLVQVRFNGPLSGVLDASISYDLSDHIGIDVGRFKTPFSTEFLTPASGIDFVNRSQVAAVLSPRRQNGAQIRLSSDAARTFTLHAGAFNSFLPALFGSGFEHSYVARGTFAPVRTDGSLVQFAVNGAITRSRVDSLTDPGTTYPAGHLHVIGADVRVEFDRWLVTGEFTYGESEEDGSPHTNPRGLQASLGYLVADNMQVLARWDGIKLDTESQARDLLIAGWNWWPTKVTEIQLNYLYDVHDVGPRRHAVLVNFQFGF